MLMPRILFSFISPCNKGYNVISILSYSMQPEITIEFLTAIVFVLQLCHTSLVDIPRKNKLIQVKNRSRLYTVKLLRCAEKEEEMFRNVFTLRELLNCYIRGNSSLILLIVKG